MPCDINKIKKFVKNKILLIEDCAQAFVAQNILVEK